MSETKPKSKWKHLPKNSILRRMEDSNPEIRERFEEWVRDLPIFGEGPAYWFGVTHPFDVNAKKWRLRDYDVTWHQVVVACCIDPKKNVSLIAREIFLEFTAEALEEATWFLHVDVIKAYFHEMRRLAIKPQPVEIVDIDYKFWRPLWNASVKALDAQRQFETAVEQEKAQWHSVNAAAYVIATSPCEDPDEVTWVWVRGHDRAVARGVETCPPEVGSYVFNLPDFNMLDIVLAAWGDCPAADRIREDLGDGDGGEYQKTCRRLTTVSAMTEVYGTQPSWPECRID